jgi:hypothetical protein
MNRTYPILRQAMASLIAYNEWLRSGSKDCCRCPREQDTLAGFAPPEVAVPDTPKSRELFCTKCGRPRSYLELIDFRPDRDYQS